MRFRKLRITSSVVWGLSAVLLIVLWVRSYWCVDGVSISLTGKHYLGVASSPGTIGFAIHSNGPLPGGDYSRFKSVNTEEWLKEIRRANLFNISRVWGTFHFGIHGYMTPNWLAMAVFMTLAALPWLRWRFSLRALLIATTLVAMVLGLVVYTAK